MTESYSVVDPSTPLYALHKGEAMDSKRRQWAAQGLYLYYLPPYSLELNRIELL